MNMNTIKVRSPWVSWPRLLLPCVIVWFAGCNRFDGPRVFVDWNSPKPELREDMIARLQGVDIGIVKKVTFTGVGTTAEVRLIDKLASRVGKKSAVILRLGDTEKTTFIEILPIRDAQSLPIQEGERLRGVNSELEATAIEIFSDWEKVTIYIGGGIVALIVLVLIVRLLFKLWVVIVCAAGGCASAIFCTGYLTPYVAKYVPLEARPDLVSYVVSFLAGYIVGAIILAILKAPLRVAATEQR